MIPTDRDAAGPLSTAERDALRAHAARCDPHTAGLIRRLLESDEGAMRLVATACDQRDAAEARAAEYARQRDAIAGQRDAAGRDRDEWRQRACDAGDEAARPAVRRGQ